MILTRRQMLQKSNAVDRRGALDRFSRVAGGKCASILSGNSCLMAPGQCMFQDYKHQPDRLGKLKCTKKLDR